MKKLILAALLACWFAPVQAQLTALPMVDEKPEITEVVKLDSSFKTADLFKTAKIYFVNIYSIGVTNKPASPSHCTTVPAFILAQVNFTWLYKYNL